MDVIQHTLDNYPKAADLRLLLKYKLNFYHVPAKIDVLNKCQLFQLAIYGKPVFKKVICKYLIDVGMY